MRAKKSSQVASRKCSKVFLKRIRFLKTSFLRFKGMQIFLRIYLRRCFSLPLIKIRLRSQVRDLKLSISLSVIIKIMRTALRCIANKWMMLIVGLLSFLNKNYQSFKNKL